MVYDIDERNPGGILRAFPARWHGHWPILSSGTGAARVTAGRSPASKKGVDPPEEDGEPKESSENRAACPDPSGHFELPLNGECHVEASEPVVLALLLAPSTLAPLALAGWRRTRRTFALGGGRRRSRRRTPSEV